MNGPPRLNLAFRLTTRLRNCGRGSASVEFALWTALFFAVVMVALDFGLYHLQAERADQAVGAAAVQTFQQASNAGFASIPAYVRAYAADSALGVTTSCNGTAGACTNVNRTCACLTSNGAFVALSCGSSCSGTGMTAGSTAGYYLTITASRNFAAIVVPRGLLNNAIISRSATVRLQ
ncbi:MAG: TadE family protein [Novosphingobium sp.]